MQIENEGKYYTVLMSKNFADENNTVVKWLLGELVSRLHVFTL